jgi:hypothetical protein
VPLVRPLDLIAAALVIACQAGCARPRESGPVFDSRRGDSVESVPRIDTGNEGGVLLINEAVSDNKNGLEDGYGDSSDWIELYNPGPDDVALQGWGLSDDPSNPFRQVLPAAALLPGAFQLIYASGKTISPAGEIHAAFKLDRDGETILLSRPDGSVSDRLELPALRQDVSYGRSQPFSDHVLVSDGTVARYATAAEPGWNQAGFDDSAWAEGTLPLGFDLGGGGGTPENVALFRTTTQSSDGYGFTGAQATDGESSTFSHTGDGDLEPSWQVDLAGTFRISSILLLNREDCCQDRLYNVSVSVLDAGGSEVWTSELQNPVAEGESPSSPGTEIALALPDPTFGSFVRVSKNAVGGAYSSEWLSLAEVIVMGVSAAPYEGRIATDVASALYPDNDRLYARLSLPEIETPDRLVLKMGFDDAFVAWLGGVELLRSSNYVVDVVTEAHDSVADEEFLLDPASLPEGAKDPGILAFEVRNVAPDDPDLLLAPTLVSTTFSDGDAKEENAFAWFDAPTPDAPNGTGFEGFVADPSVDVPRGFFDSPFALALSSDTAGATLVYTLDGSVPTTDHGTTVLPADKKSRPTVSIPVETTTILRAMAYESGYAPSAVVTHTYLFLEDVIRQPADPPGVPAVWYDPSQGSFTADYAMDPEVVDDPAYHDDLLAGLRDIPTLSVVLDPDDLFGETDGIYVYSLGRGDEWERPASVEYILPDGSTGFQADCGLRIHGYGWRYHSVTSKHAFRLEFRSEYGASKLEYPLFPDSPVDRFDSIVLRAQGSKGWQDFRDPAESQYIHDAFARDTARDMGKLDGHATFVHLYLNGLYWGLYNPVERPEAGFGEEYLGGDDDEYDAINRRTTVNEAVNGTLEAYDTLLALADEDLSTEKGYAAVAAMLDVDDLIDYMLIHQYMTNRDGPCCFEHNNMRGIRRRVDGEKFRFFVWDMEYSLWEATDDINVDVDIPGAISHVYARLRANATFRARYSEHAHMHLYGHGALTPVAAAARWESRATQIERAIVGESARWGDADREPPYTRDVEWEAERRRLLTEYFPYRTDVLIAQLTAAGLLVP